MSDDGAGPAADSSDDPPPHDYAETLLHDLEARVIEDIGCTIEGQFPGDDPLFPIPYMLGDTFTTVPVRFVDAVANRVPVQSIDDLLCITTPPPTLAAQSAVTLVVSSPPCTAKGGCGCWRCIRLPHVMRRMAQAAADVIRVITTTVDEENNQTILQATCCANDINAVGSLLAMGADPNARADEEQYTPLHEAMNGSPFRPLGEPHKMHIVDMLLRAGADPEMEAGDDGSPLCFAVRRRLPLCAKMLVDAGARPDRQNQDGHTALGLYITMGSFDMARVFLRGGADVDLMSHREWTLCIAAARRARANDIVDVLNARAPVRM